MELPKVQQFKVYFENELEVRRYNVNLPYNTLFQDIIHKKVKDVLGHENFRVTWKDSDGDSILCQSEDDLHVALHANGNKDLLCLYVKSISPPQYQLPPPEVAPRQLQGSLQQNRMGRSSQYMMAENLHPHGTERHRNVLCDGCDSAIYGTRYKCIVCPDFDLCVKCETKGMHRSHDAVAIRNPTDHGWKKLFVARESAVYGRHHHHESHGSKSHHLDGPTVELALNLNQPLETLLRDVNNQVQKVLKGFMPQPIPQPPVVPLVPVQEVFTESLVIMREERVPESQQEVLDENVVVTVKDDLPTVVADINSDNEVETLHESTTEQDSAKPEEMVVIQNIYPVIFPHLVTATEQAEAISIAESRRSASPTASLNSSEDEGWALVSDRGTGTKDAVTETAPCPPPTKDSPSAQIEAALVAMSEMGFKNEGNLLRALLENFHGDIGKVLDTISN